MFKLNFRDRLQSVSQALVDEFDNVVTEVAAWLKIEHKEDGTHADVTADSVTLRGSPATVEDVTLTNQTRTLDVQAERLVVRPVTVAGRLYRAVQIGWHELYSAVTSGRGAGVVFEDPTNERPSWAIVAGLPDNLSASRDSLRVVDVVGQAQVFQVSKIGSEYFVCPSETQAVSPPAEASLGHVSTGHRWKKLYVKDIDFSGTLTGTITATAPTGAAVMWPTATPPTGWLLMDGSAVSRATYADLFDLIGTTYGSGDGSTTFNLPDMRGRFPFGKAASGTGATLGGTFGAIDHTHSGGNTGAGGSHAHTMTGSVGSAGAHTHAISGSSGSAGDHHHTVSLNAVDVQAGTGQFVNEVVSSDTSTDGAHTHGAGTYAADSDGAHTHDAGTLGTNTVGDHTHTWGPTGAANPPALVWNFIIKT